MNVLLKTGKENLAIFNTLSEAELVRIVLFKGYDTTIEELHSGSVMVNKPDDLVKQGQVMLDKVMELTGIGGNSTTH